MTLIGFACCIQSIYIVIALLQRLFTTAVTYSDYILSNDRIKMSMNLGERCSSCYVCGTISTVSWRH